MTPEEANELLLDAVTYDRADFVKLLIEKGADVNAADWFQQTALHHAAHYGDVDTVKLLIKKGANTAAKNRFGETPLSWAANRSHTDIVNLLGDAANQSHHAGRVTAERKDKGPPQVGS